MGDRELPASPAPPGPPQESTTSGLGGVGGGGDRQLGGLEEKSEEGLAVAKVKEPVLSHHIALNIIKGRRE